MRSSGLREGEDGELTTLGGADLSGVDSCGYSLFASCTHFCIPNPASTPPLTVYSIATPGSPFVYSHARSLALSPPVKVCPPSLSVRNALNIHLRPPKL